MNKSCSPIKLRRLKFVTGQPNASYASPPCLLNEGVQQCAPHSAATGRETDIWYGTVNTAVLLTSSLTMAVAAQAAEAEYRRLTLWCLAGTMALGLAFLVLKGFEYAEDIEKNLVPGSHFVLAEPAAQLFFALYWLMTAVHAIHLTIGLELIGRLIVFGKLRIIALRENPQVEVTALYWHLVDIIWIVLYPLIYLMGRT